MSTVLTVALAVTSATLAVLLVRSRRQAGTMTRGSERARAEIAETLQRGLLPPPLPHIPGWSAAAMYRPAGVENEVGGDFYDAFPVEGGWMIVIGDVTGRGARAASITAQARYTLRTAAILTGDPLLALATLNRALLARRDSALCSVAALSLSEDPEQPVRIAVAGHPPPLLVDGEAVAEAGAQGPLLGAFADAEWSLERVPVGPGQQLVVITDGITEAPGAEGRFGETRLRAELAGATSPVLAVQRLEGALHAFTAGKLDDDAAILAISRAGGVGAESPGLEGVMVERLFEAFNRRDEAGIAALCDERMEFFPVTAQALGRIEPYVGPAGLQEYLEDIGRAWEELLILPKQVEVEGDGSRLRVRGRVYLRSRELGIRDIPVAWIWQLAEGRFVRGEVFADPEEAALAAPATAA
jgi:serine phosphatase RsbU (regulator of sigma subunit)/ketosteroid isomerase-like protein